MQGFVLSICVGIAIGVLLTLSLFLAGQGQAQTSVCLTVETFLIRSAIATTAVYLVFGQGIIFDHVPYSELFLSSDSSKHAALIYALSLVECAVWVPMTVNVISLFLYPPVWTRPCQPKTVVDKGHTDEAVCFRFVTRGDNPKALTHALKVCQSAVDEQTQEQPSFFFEVVTDTRVPGLDVTQIVVPSKSEYQTRNNTLYKARALNYASDVSDLRDKDWIIHMDEESTIDKHNLGVVLQWIHQETRKRTDVGQGLISYNNPTTFDSFSHYICTLADSVRVADDMFRFRFQYDFLHSAPFGIHGSFLVVNNGFEKEVGLDLGPDCSLTEDSAFALKSLSYGAQFHYLDSEVHEQSPISLTDFCHQRARWMKGLWFVVLDQQNDIRTRNKVLLSCMIVPWTLAPFYFLYVFLQTVVKLTMPILVFTSTNIMHNLMTFFWLIIYVSGFVRSSWFSKFPFWKALLFYVSFPFLVWIALLFEFCAASFAFTKTVNGIINKHSNSSVESGFHVVRKDLASHSELHSPLLAGA